MLRTNDTSFSFRGQSCVHAKQCIGRAANQYSCLTYTAWLETLYTGIGRTAILLSLHERNYKGTMAKYEFRCVTHSVQLQYQYCIVTTGILLNSNSVWFSRLYCFFRVYIKIIASVTDFLNQRFIKWILWPGARHTSPFYDPLVQKQNRVRHGKNIYFTRVVVSLLLIGHQTSHLQNKHVQNKHVQRRRNYAFLCMV